MDESLEVAERLIVMIITELAAAKLGLSNAWDRGFALSERTRTLGLNTSSHYDQQMQRLAALHAACDEAQRILRRAAGIDE